MKIDIDPYKFIILLILVGSSAGALFAQSPFDAERREEAMQIREKVVVFTDRSLYAVEEVIHFVADHRVNGPIGINSWSSVLYVELVASSGEALA